LANHQLTNQLHSPTQRTNQRKAAGDGVLGAALNEKHLCNISGAP
jgi:hypothetical protein